MQSKENLAFSRVVTSFWVKLIPFWMDHTVGTIGQITANFVEDYDVDET
jgi:hypothetical protein